MELTILFTLCAIGISILGFVNSRKSTANQEAGLKLQFTQHEERQKTTVANQFDKLKTELSSQKSEADRNSATVSLRLSSIEKKVDGVEEMHTEIALIKQHSMHVVKLLEGVQNQLQRQAEQYNTPQSNGNSPTRRRKSP